jgi:ribosomal protein S27AE
MYAMNEPAPAAQLPQEFLDLLAKAFEDRGVNKPCPRCGHPYFSIYNSGVLNHVLQTYVDELNITGAGYPTVITFCNNCGFVSQHALVALGLLDDALRTLTKAKKKASS